jgi:REP element-mobilizing transposase RayT
MSRLARMVVLGLPDHVTQRGNRREAVFFEDGDQKIYCDLLGEQSRKFTVEVWDYCLMPNHVHLILTPQGADGMSRALGEAHRRYTNFINAVGKFLGQSTKTSQLTAIRRSTYNGRALGSQGFTHALEKETLSPPSITGYSRLSLRCYGLDERDSVLGK